MNKKKTILFCGGDSRLLSTARAFRDDNYKCIAYFCDFSDESIEKTEYIRNDADAVILSIPSFTSDYKLNGKADISAEQMFSRLKPGTDIFGGMIQDFIFKLAREYNLSVHDYGARDDFAMMNAVPTAEAAIMTAMQISQKTLYGSDFAVIGYGRIGRALAVRLRSLGGNVTVATRSLISRYSAICDGFNTFRLGEYLKRPARCDFLFNTVPCRIIGIDCVADSTAVFIDLASAPGGFDKKAEELLKTRLIRALSLPGKYSPYSAGKIIYSTINNMIDEFGG